MGTRAKGGSRQCLCVLLIKLGLFLKPIPSPRLIVTERELSLLSQVQWSIIGLRLTQRC